MRSLPERLGAQAARAPHATAVIQGGRRVSWAELAAEAGRFEAALLAGGVVPGERVGVLGENSPEIIAALYGVLGAGAVAVSLNTAARAAEAAGVMVHADARVLLAQANHPEVPALLSRLAPHVRVILLGPGGDALGPRADEPEGGPRDAPRPAETWDALRSRFEPAAPRGVDPESLASILYTSGTTGSPKGVALRHRNCIANVESILAYLPLSPEDRTLCVLPFHYAYGASVLHTHISAGATLVLENSLAFPQRVLAVAAAERVTGLPGVPSTFALLLRRAHLGNFDLTSLRWLSQAGGAMAPVLTDELRAALPQARLYVMYGQTEATARLTWLPPERLAEKRGACGRAIPGVELRIADPRSGETLATGESGEVCARGDNIMAGYWRNEEATRAVLREGWLHTGDLGRLDAEGFLFLDGRRGDMIKSGAHRISPFEIEEVLLGFAGVEEAIAVAAVDELLGEVVKAIVVPRSGVELDPLALQRHCRDALAAYKVPKQVELVRELPRTSSGKVVRRPPAETM